MPGEHWTASELALLKRAGRIYADAEGVPQWRLIVACEPELSERGYDAIRVRGRLLMADDDATEASDGLRYDRAPEAVYAQARGLVEASGSRSTMPPAFLADGVQGGPVVTDTEGGKSVHYVGRHLRTEQELRDHAGLDRERWECASFKVNNYQQASKGEDGETVVTTLYQTNARFTPRPEYDALESFREAILADIAEHAPVYPAYNDPPPSDDPHMLEFSPFDLHIGKLAWAPETGENYDSKIARELLIQATEDVLRKVQGFPITKILFPIGNDLFHTDNPEQTTSRGTPQDTDSRPDLMHDRAERLLVDVIDRLATVAPVKLITVPGNHDRQAAQWMGRVMRARYSNNDRVEVDCGPTLRKYERWGIALLGFTHGSEEKHRDLPLIMAREVSNDWAECEQFEIHVGHHHKSKQTVYAAGDSFNGVRVRVLPSLCGADGWHASMGYVKSWRAVESYLWSERTGFVGYFSSNVTTTNGEQRIAA